MLSEYDEGVERVLDMQSEAYKMQKVLKELHTILSGNEVLSYHNLLYVRCSCESNSAGVHRVYP